MRGRVLLWFAVPMLAACGRVGFDPRLTAVDAIDAADGFVDVTTAARSGTGPKAAVVVWTSRLDGSIDDAQLTDAGGAAHLHLQAGGAVSAAYSPSQEFVVASWSVHTILGAEPGDQLTFGGHPPTCDSTVRGSATVTFPAYTGATFYELATACSGAFVGASPYTWQLAASDADPSDVVLVAHGGTTGVLIAAARQPAVALPDGAMVTFQAADWHPAPLVQLGLANVPAALTKGAISAYYYAGTSDTLVTSGYSGGVMAAGGTVAALLPVPDITTRARIVTRVTDPTGAFGIELETDPGAPSVATWPPAPPSLEQPAFDPATRAVTWTTGSGAVTGDRLEVFLALQDTAGELIDWRVWAPPTFTSIVVPELPMAVPAYDPQLAQNQQPPTVMLVDYPDQATWLQARTAPDWDSPLSGWGHPHVATLAAAAGHL